MERVEGYFDDARKDNSSVGVFILILAGIILLILTLMLKNTVFIFFFFPFGIVTMSIVGLSKIPRKTKVKIATKLVLTKIGECFRLERQTQKSRKTLFEDLKWKELIIAEKNKSIKDNYYNYYDVTTARQLQLRIWNEKGQVVLIERLEKQPVDGIKVFKMTELHKADFISLESGTLKKMDDLMNISESIWE